MDNNLSNKIPVFCSSKLYLSFEQSDYEDSYGQLISDLWGESVKPRPKRGVNPFDREPLSITLINFDVPASFSNPSTKSTVSINPTSNQGHYWVGEGEMMFELYWSKHYRGSIYIYNDPESIHSLCIVPKSFKDIGDIVDATDTSLFYLVERCDNLGVGEIAVLQNTSGYYLAVKIEQVLYRCRNGDDKDELTFSYEIAPAKSTSFAKIA